MKETSKSWLYELEKELHPDTLMSDDWNNNKIKRFIDSLSADTKKFRMYFISQLGDSRKQAKGSIIQLIMVSDIIYNYLIKDLRVWKNSPQSSNIRGYTNKITEGKKKFIAPHDFEAPLLKWAFEQIVSNNFNTEQIWKMVREKADGKGRFSKNNFWVAVRNPLYCGKIFIPSYKEEKGYFVKGQHEPLISEKTFADVQDILDGRKRVVKPKIVAMDNLPLRGFIKCPNPNCNRMLTGSASKGKMGNYYYYYHCTSSCGVRFKAETANEAFLKQLRYMSPKEGMVDVFIEAFIKDFNNKTKAQNTERTNIISEIDALNKRYQNALLKNADGEMANDDFQEVKKLTKGKIEVLESRLNDLAVVGTEIKDLVASTLKKVANIDRRYENGDIEEKRLIVSSMFPDFFVI